MRRFTEQKCCRETRSQKTVFGKFSRLFYWDEHCEIQANVADIDVSPAETSISSNHTMREPNVGTTVPGQLQDEHPVPELNDSSKVYEGYVIYGEKCRIRSYDYADPVILKEYFADEPRRCPGGAKPFLFYPVLNSTTGRSCIGVNETVLEEWYGGDIEEWTCIYREIGRDLDSEIIDMNFAFGETKTLKVGDCPSEEFIWIRCKPEESTRDGISRLLPVLVKMTPISMELF